MQRVQVLKSGKYKFVKNKSGKSASSPKKRTKSGGRKVSSTTSSSGKKFTVGKALDMASLAGPAVIDGVNTVLNPSRTAQDGLELIVTSYTGYNPIERKMYPGYLVRGYGGAANRVIEKKLFRAMGIRGPRTGIKTIGDLLDYTSYFGKTAYDVYVNKDNPSAALVEAYKTQFGVDLNETGYDAYAKGFVDMAMDKWLPYMAQKKVRQVLAMSGIKMPTLRMG